MDEPLPAEVLVVRVVGWLLGQGPVHGAHGARAGLHHRLPRRVDRVVVDQVGAGRASQPRIFEILLKDKFSLSLRVYSIKLHCTYIIFRNEVCAVYAYPLKNILLLLVRLQHKCDRQTQL